MTQERIDARLTSAEINKQFHWRFTAALLQNFTQEAFACLRVKNAFFFETRKGICRSHLVSFVAVIASRIAARKNMTEDVLETIKCRWLHHRNVVSHLIHNGLWVLRVLRIVIRVQAKIE